MLDFHTRKMFQWLFVVLPSILLCLNGVQKPNKTRYKSSVLITSYQELINITQNGGIIKYRINIPSANVSIESTLSTYEWFVNETQAAEYGTEYVSLYSSEIQTLSEYKEPYFGFTVNNSQIQIFSQIRIFKNPTIMINKTHNKSIEFVQYCTIIFDNTNKYKINQRTCNIDMFFNFNDSNSISFSYNKASLNNIKQEIINFDELYQFATNSYCVFTQSLRYYATSNGMDEVVYDNINSNYINKEHPLVAGSYTVLESVNFISSDSNDAKAQLFGSYAKIVSAENYLWYGLEIQVLDIGETILFNSTFENEYGIYDGYIETYARITDLINISNMSELYVGQVIENEIFYLQWQKSLKMWAYCF